MEIYNSLNHLVSLQLKIVQNQIPLWVEGEPGGRSKLSKSGRSKINPRRLWQRELRSVPSSLPAGNSTVTWLAHTVLHISCGNTNMYKLYIEWQLKKLFLFFLLKGDYPSPDYRILVSWTTHHADTLNKFGNVLPVLHWEGTD